MAPVASRLKIGQVLIGRGILTPQQVDEILDVQKFNNRPFGDLAERMFNVCPEAVEEAWVEQYLTYDTQTSVSEEDVDEQVVQRVTRRQAWQFRILPLYCDRGQLVAATTRQHLRRAVNFAWSSLEEPTYFLIASEAQIEKLLDQYYPWPSMMRKSA